MNNFSKQTILIQAVKYTLIFGCIFAVYVSQVGIDEIWASESYERRLSQTVLPVDTTRRISLGMDNVLADLYWLNAIQYLGVGVSQGGHPALPVMLENTTTLDPDFEYPYIFSSLILPGEGHTKEAIKISDKGLKNVPDSWQIPYYAALSIYQIQLGDYSKAANLVEIASKKLDAPESLPYIAAILRSRTDDNIKAYLTWKVIYQSEKNQYSRDRAKLFLEHYQIIFYLEKLIENYKTTYGIFPNSLQDLIKTGYLKEIPADPLERGFIYNNKTGKISTDNSRRFQSFQ